MLQKTLIALTLSMGLTQTAQAVIDIKVLSIACEVTQTADSIPVGKEKKKPKAIFTATFPKKDLDSKSEIVYTNSAISLLELDGKRSAEVTEDILKSTEGIYVVGEASDDGGVIEKQTYVIHTESKPELVFSQDSSFFGIKKGTYKTCTATEDIL